MKNNLKTQIFLLIVSFAILQNNVAISNENPSTIPAIPVLRPKLKPKALLPKPSLEIRSPITAPKVTKVQLPPLRKSVVAEKSEPIKEDSKIVVSKNPEKNQAQSVQGNKDKGETVSVKLVKAKPAALKHDISLMNYLAYFENSYEQTFILALTSLPVNHFKVVSFDMASGRIFCEHEKGKSLIVHIAPALNDHTLVRFSPIDGKYDFSKKVMRRVFVEMHEEIKASLSQQKASS